MISSAAKLSKEEIAKRRCFLCRENRPAEQIMLKFEGRKGKKYDILVNPYPIFPDHLVIAKSKHTDQSIWHRYVDMLDLARKYSGYTFFYNGPKSGASAPDHHHFQGAPKGLMPLENDVNASLDGHKKVISTGGSAIYGEGAMNHLREMGLVVYLKLSCGELAERLGDLNARGVTLQPGQNLESLYEERVPLYEKYAHVVISCDGKYLRDIVNEIAAAAASFSEVQ
jgi:hypothetical protein